MSTPRLFINSAVGPATFGTKRIAGFAILLVLALMLAPSSQAQSGLKLPPHITHNMVVQDRDNILWGSGPPGSYVGAEFGRVSESVKIDDAGNWKLKLDFKVPQGSSAGGDLVFYLGPKRKPKERALVLTNVAVGEVWLVGLEDGKGASIANAPNLRFDGNCRVLTVTNTAALTQSSATTGGFQILSGSGAARDVSALTWFFGQYRSGNGTPVGIIQTSAASLKAALRPEAGTGDQDAARFNWEQAQATVTNMVAQRRRDFIQLKRAGLVTNAPPLAPFPQPAVHLRNDFNPAIPGIGELRFEGAVW